MTRKTPGPLHLGHVVDAASGRRTGDHLAIDPRDLTTHAVIVGMTGSGKTGLGMVVIEEALLSGVPALILDPKGDMANLRLAFPDMRPEDFAPWLSEDEARRQGLSVEELAARTAGAWRDGLAASGVALDRVRALRNATEVTLYTPGSTAGTPLNVIGSLRAPALDWAGEQEALRDEIQGLVSGLLGLAGLDSDPVTGREHILLANLVEHAWSQKQDLDLGTLIMQVQRPPLRKLGVLDLDTFFAERDRQALAMRLNGLLASPSFAAWMDGPDLNVGRLLEPTAGRTPAAILYLAHLSEAERQFVVTLVLAKAVTWYRGLSGSSGLRALVYMDEVFGYAPPTANPPSKKPILTILKQARAYGVGMVLATQNPVDLDYKAMANAGSWLVGRLQTERDKARVVDGLASARGGVDVAALDRVIGGLGKRQFLLQSAHRDQPTLFDSRWAMCFLAGPLTREQVARLTTDAPRPAAGAGASPTDSGKVRAEPAAGPAPSRALAADESPVPPLVAPGVPVRYLHPAAPWGRDIGASPRGDRLEAALAARVRMKFRDARAGIEHDEEWEAVFHPLTPELDPRSGLTVDYDARDFETEPPPGAVYAIPAAALDKATTFQRLERSLREALYRDRAVTVLRNRELRLYGRVGEDRDAFARRCDEGAQDGADREAAALRTRFQTRLKTAQDKLLAAELRLEQARVDHETRRRHEMLSGAGDLLNALLTGRSRTRSIVRSVSRGSSRRAVTERSGQRVATVEELVLAYARDIEQLEADVADALTEIDARWRAKAEAVDTLEITPTRNDVTVQEVVLVWVPMVAGTT